MKVRLLLSFLFFIMWNTICLSQTWIDSIRTIYTSSSKVHQLTFMKPILPYYAGYRTTLMVVEDSGTVSLFKVASFNSYNSDIPSFHTILTRSSLIGKAKFIGFYNDKDSLYQQFLFWEEGSGAEQRIMYSIVD